MTNYSKLKGDHMTASRDDFFVFQVQRPWWWLLNPWLYASRRDRAYESAIESLYDMSMAMDDPSRQFRVAS